MCAMEPSRGVSRVPPMLAGQLLMFTLSTAACIGAVDAYFSSPSLSYMCSSNSPGTVNRITSSGSVFFGPGETSFSSRSRSHRLYSSDSPNLDKSDKPETEETEFISVSDKIANDAFSRSPEAQFGDVNPMQQNNSSTSAAKFGDVVSISRPSSSSTPETISSKPSGRSEAELLKQRRIRNIGVAILSVALAIGNYAYQWTHPVTPIQLLVNMERSSAPLSVVGKNSKPTVIDFWAPWCENCRYMAPTLYQVEESYKDKVNFVMVNGDDPNNWPLIEALGVDAIPHLALMESDGTVDTALIGAVPKEWLSSDIDVLLDNAGKISGGEETTKRPLPFRMLDVFANRPGDRKITNLDTIIDAGRR